MLENRVFNNVYNLLYQLDKFESDCKKKNMDNEQFIKLMEEYKDKKYENQRVLVTIGLDPNLQGDTFKLDKLEADELIQIFDLYKSIVVKKREVAKQKLIDELSKYIKGV